MDVLRSVDVEAVPPEDLADAIGVLTRLDVQLRQALAARPATNGNPPSRLDRLLTVDEVAAKLGMKPTWVHRHKRELGGIKLSGKALRFPEKAIARFLAARRISP